MKNIDSYASVWTYKINGWVGQLVLGITFVHCGLHLSPLPLNSPKDKPNILFQNNLVQNLVQNSQQLLPKMQRVIKVPYLKMKSKKFLHFSNLRQNAFTLNRSVLIFFIPLQFTGITHALMSRLQLIGRKMLMFRAVFSWKVLRYSKHSLSPFPTRTEMLITPISFTF